MRMYDIIRKKRDGEELSKEELAFFIEGYTKGEIPDYQASALCMTIVLRGMNDIETAVLTDCMAHSGDMLDLSRYGHLSVDKHSTGGVGDKTSLVVGPIAAALGGTVAKMSGRALGHTGGTLDKLEAIPGYRTDLSEEELFEAVSKSGMAIIAQTGNLTPADKKLYALRDVTATIDSIPLIVSSIMSKKLAAGSKNIVLDVKCGSGAFMKTLDDAEQLAQKMIAIGKHCGRNISALITDMDKPLGKAVGNALEVKEAAEVLRGNEKGDLYEVCVALATEMVTLFKNIAPEEAEKEVVNAISSGKAYQKMIEWIKGQGGDPAYIEDPSLFPAARVSHPLYSPHDGYIARMDAEKIGMTEVLLGAGRTKKEDKIDHSAGIIIEKKTGDYVKAGELLATLYTSSEELLPAAEKTYRSALTFAQTPPAPIPLVYKILR